MEIIKINIQKPAEEVLKRAVKVIKNSGVVVYPTDTAYGLAANALDEKSIGKLFIIKQRVQKPLPVIVDSEKMLRTIAIVSEAEKKLIKKFWPGALTIIFKKKDKVQPFLTLGLPTIGVRIPDLLLDRKLAKMSGTPLTSTSANISGQGNCYTPECVSRMFGGSATQPDLLLDGGELPERPVSTVVQVENKKVKVIRQGAVKIKKI